MEMCPSLWSHTGYFAANPLFHLFMLPPAVNLWQPLTFLLSSQFSLFQNVILVTLYSLQPFQIGFLCFFKGCKLFKIFEHFQKIAELDSKVQRLQKKTCQIGGYLRLADPLSVGCKHQSSWKIKKISLFPLIPVYQIIFVTNAVNSCIRNCL